VFQFFLTIRSFLSETFEVALLFGLLLVLLTVSCFIGFHFCGSGIYAGSVDLDSINLRIQIN